MNHVDQLPAEIGSALDRGAVVVTGNERAARTLRRTFDLRNRQSGRQSWRSPQIFAWEAWTAMLWHRLLIDGHASRLLLNQTQEHAIWRNILSADVELKSLRSKDTLALLAAEAWQCLCSYQGQSQLRGNASSADALAFERWVVAFHRKCRDAELLTRAELEDALTTAVKSNHLRLEQPEVIIYGFDRLSPAQTALVEALQATGCKTTDLHQPVPVENRLLVRTDDEEHEIRAAARWASHFLVEHPEAHIAVVLPSLTEHRAKVDSIFREVLAPELQHITSPESASPYEFSLGIQLAQIPMVRTALDLLHLYAGLIPIDRASGLLLSPYFAMKTTERGARAEFDAFEVRQALRLRPEISLEWLNAAAYESPRRLKLGQFSGTLEAMCLAVSHLNLAHQKSHAEWTLVIQELLKTSQWHADNETSVDFQIRKRWRGVLDEFASLDFDGSRIDFSHALASLERIVAQTVFAPGSHEAPIQVMGALEAAGSTFDAIWLMHAGDLSWPIPESSSPLLSWRLQRDLKMPGTDISLDSLHARKITERIISSAPTTIVSYSTEIAEGKQQPSPSLEELGLKEIAPEEIAPPEPLRIVISLEPLDDVEPIPTVPDSIAHGGAQTLKDQAQCPFRAFAEHRLRSTEIEQVSLGMDAAASGIAVHRALELFWDEVKTQQRLRLMTSNELASTLDRCIVRSLAKIDSLAETSWDSAYMQMQRARMKRLLINWLELEMQRAPFEVKANEVKLDDVQVGPLRLKVRVDRIDSTDTGTILIDYKTGDVSPRAWLTERPDEPQLPLYATVAQEASLQGVAFGLVRAGENCDLVGFGATAGVLPHQRKLEVGSLDEQIEQWKQVLNKLASDFYHGEARVEPKSYPKTCMSCSQRILCRVDPSQLPDKEDESKVNHG